MKRKQKNESKSTFFLGSRLILLFVVSASISTFITLSIPKIKVPSTTTVLKQEIIYADAFTIIKNVVVTGNKERILLVDMRSKVDYDKNRLKNSVNVHFPYEKDHKGQVAFVKEVKELAKKYKAVVLLPYSSASLTGEDAVRKLKNEGMDNVSLMRVGWNELYNLPNLWIPEDQVEKFNLSTLLDN